MPDPSDVRPTSHARHDPLVVAALAAGDLAGTDRDHATALIESCAECATLHDDLIAIARATASVPPPIATRPRDFRLTPEQAARLRPTGWRRVVGAFASPRLAFSKPLGIGLTTIGLAGLLIGNIPLGFGLGGSAASAPVFGATGAAAAASESNQSIRGSAGDVTGEVSVPAASNAALGPVSVPAASAAASAAPAQVAGSLGGSTTAPAAAGSPKIAAPVPEAQSSDQRLLATSQPTIPAPITDLRTLFFAVAIVVGLGLLVLRRVARRVTAA
jgi:hypothetical protein